MRSKYLITESDITHACVETMLFWADPRYQEYVGSRRTNALKAEWFKWFVGEWSVARLIGEGNQDKVRKYLDSTLGKSIDSKGAGAVDVAARHIQDQEWSSRYGKKKKGFRNPLSLVSKVGFLLAPDRISPLDRFSRIGVGRILATSRRKRSNDLEGTYATYLANFDRAFAGFKGQIQQELSSSWAQELAPKLGCNRAVLALPEFRRKVFDNVLMRIGRRRASR